MQIPSLPTDNLYKFLAVSGLVIIVLSVVYPLSKSKEFAMQQNDLIAKMSVQNIELKTFAEELGTFVKELESLSRGLDQEIRAKHKQINNERKKLDIAKAKLEAEKEQVKYLEKNLIFYTKAGLIGIAFGIFLTIIGFVLWYRRVQRYQDAILKDQYMEAIKPNKGIGSEPT